MFGRKPGCWHPRDARWQTTYSARVMGRRRQMQIDRALASYDPRPVALLTDRSALQALRMLASGSSVREVAAEFGTSVWCIYDLKGGRTHKHLPR